MREIIFYWGDKKKLKHSCELEEFNAWKPFMCSLSHSHSHDESVTKGMVYFSSYPNGDCFVDNFKGERHFCSQYELLSSVLSLPRPVSSLPPSVRSLPTSVRSLPPSVRSLAWKHLSSPVPSPVAVPDFAGGASPRVLSNIGRPRWFVFVINPSRTSRRKCYRLVLVREGMNDLFDHLQAKQPGQLGGFIPSAKQKYLQAAASGFSAKLRSQESSLPPDVVQAYEHLRRGVEGKPRQDMNTSNCAFLEVTSISDKKLAVVGFDGSFENHRPIEKVLFELLEKVHASKSQCQAGIFSSQCITVIIFERVCIGYMSSEINDKYTANVGVDNKTYQLLAKYIDDGSLRFEENERGYIPVCSSHDGQRNILIEHVREIRFRKDDCNIASAGVLLNKLVCEIEPTETFEPVRRGAACAKGHSLQ